MKNERIEKVNWREIWADVKEVTPERWAQQKQKLRESHNRLIDMLENYDKWDGEYGISGALAVLTHTAYHLGGLRQALCAIRSTHA